MQDKTFYFASGDYTRQDRTTYLSSTLPAFVLPPDGSLTYVGNLPAGRHDGIEIVPEADLEVLGDNAGAIVGLHYHLHQADYWYVPFGTARMVLHDLRAGGEPGEEAQFSSKGEALKALSQLLQHVDP